MECRRVLFRSARVNGFRGRRQAPACPSAPRVRWNRSRTAPPARPYPSSTPWRGVFRRRSCCSGGRTGDGGGRRDQGVRAQSHRPGARPAPARRRAYRSEEHTSELQSLMRISYAVFCLKKKSQNSLPVFPPHLFFHSLFSSFFFFSTSLLPSLLFLLL